MTSWHHSEYVSIPVAKTTHRKLLVATVAAVIGVVSLAAALPDRSAQANILPSVQTGGLYNKAVGGVAIRNIIEEHAKAKSDTKSDAKSDAKAATVGKTSAASKPATITKPVTLAAAKQAADPVTTGSVRSSGSSAASRKVHATGNEDAIARLIRSNPGFDTSGTSSGAGPVFALNR